MKKILGFIFLLQVFHVNAQSRITWAVEGGPNVSWAKKIMETQSGFIRFRPAVAFSASVVAQYEMRNNFFLETGLCYTFNKYKYFLIGSSGTSITSDIFFPSVIGGYKKNINKKWAVTVRTGCVASPLASSDSFAIITMKNGDIIEKDIFESNRRRNILLVSGIGWLKEVDGSKKFEFLLAGYFSFAKRTRADFTFFENGFPMAESEYSFSGSYISLEWRYFFRKKAKSDYIRLDQQ